MTSNDPPVRTAIEEDGGILTLRLNRPRGNVLDTAMLHALTEGIAAAADRPSLRAILFEAEGPDFSFGASVSEHRRGEVESFLPHFHALFRQLAGTGLVLIAAVRGRCLGGGLELASFCHRVIASPDATLGSPEIRLGVIAPVASIVLPLRIGPRPAEELLLTGRDVAAGRALAIGLVDVLDEEPELAARAWFREHLAPRSAVALRFAVGAARDALHRALDETLPRIERGYLSELMATRDANEGIEAFMEKRSPTWTHH